MGWTKDNGRVAKANADYAKEQGSRASQQAELASQAADEAKDAIEFAIEHGRNAREAASHAEEQVFYAENAIQDMNSIKAATEKVKSDTLLVKQETELVKEETVQAKEEILVVMSNTEQATINANNAANNANQVATDNRTHWLPAVSTIAERNSSYPNPQHGDTVRVTSEAKTYRYVSPTGWVVTDIYNATAIDQVTQQLAENVQEVKTEAHVYAPSPSAYWVAPTQPAARTDIPGHFTDGFAYTADQYINTLFEPLRNKNSNYITRQNLGKDASGTYDVWRYDFTPENYEKTIIVIGGLHGGEVMGTLPFYLFMKEVCENWKENGQLAYIRHKVRIISIPILNPWGMSQMPRTRQNSNGVDINRNFDWKWSTTGSSVPGSHDYRGTAPFSEKEAQYVRNILESHPEATALLDLHALGAGSPEKACIYVPHHGNVANEKQWRNFIDWFVPKGELYQFRYSVSGTCSNYASVLHGLYACTAEWTSVSWGGQALNGIELTKATEYFGNIIIMHALFKNKANADVSTEPVTYYANYTGTGLTVSSTSYTTIPEFTLEFDVPQSGIILMQGEITAVASNQDTVNYFLPVLGQVGGLFEPGVLQGIYYEKYYNGINRTVIPLIGAFPVKLNDNSPTSPIGKFKFELKSKIQGAGTIDIRRYHMQLTFIPSNRVDAVKFYSAQIGGKMTLDFDGFK